MAASLVDFCSAQGVFHFLSLRRNQPPVSIPKSPEFFVAAGVDFTTPVRAPTTGSSSLPPGHAPASSSRFPLVFPPVFLVGWVFIAARRDVGLPLGDSPFRVSRTLPGSRLGLVVGFLTQFLFLFEAHIFVRCQQLRAGLRVWSLPRFPAM
jgi:hypothetical protein